MTRQRWRVVLWLSMVAVILWMLWHAKLALIPFAIGGLLAYMLTPVVDRLAALIPSRSARSDVVRRGLAVVVIYVVIGSALFGLGAMVVPVAVEQTVEFIDTLPETIAAAEEQGSIWLSRYREGVPPNLQPRIDAYLADASGAVASAIAGMAQRSVTVLTTTLGFVFGFFVTPFFMFYAMRDRHRVRNNFVRGVPAGAQADAANVLVIGDRVLVKFLRGQILLGIVVGTAVGIGLTLLDVQLSLALGIFAGITELIPIVGPWLGAIPGLIVVIATDPQRLPWVALLYLMVQQVENFFLVPRVQGSATEIHPAMVLLLLAVAGAVFGFWGLLVAVPLAAILREVFWYADARLRGLTPPAALAQTHVAKADEATRGATHDTLATRLALGAHPVEPPSSTGAAARTPAPPRAGNE